MGAFFFGVFFFFAFFLRKKASRIISPAENLEPSQLGGLLGGGKLEGKMLNINGRVLMNN